MCDGEKVSHAWIYGGMCEIRPPVYSVVHYAQIYYQQLLRLVGVKWKLCWFFLQLGNPMTKSAKAPLYRPPMNQMHLSSAMLFSEMNPLILYQCNSRVQCVLVVIATYFFYKPTFTVYDFGPPATSPTCEYRRAIRTGSRKTERGEPFCKGKGVGGTKNHKTAQKLWYSI
jgi:hypothetical protein